MTEGLHGEVGLEAQAGKLFELVARHWAGCILRAHGGHPRLAIGAWPDAGDTARFADHFLGQCKPAATVGWSGRCAEHRAWWKPERFTRARCEPSSND